MDAVQKQLFISDEIFSLTLKATVTRVKFYASNAKEKHRADFRGSLRRQLEDTAKKYVTTVSEEDHIRHIVNLAKTLTKSHSTYLDGSRFRIGRAQKALNLYLKYLWCLGKIKCPPHCPFDSEIMKLLKTCDGLKWTALDRAREYKKLVTAAHIHAKKKPLAVWELQEYNKSKKLFPDR
jgi:hypothetical protein